MWRKIKVTHFLIVFVALLILNINFTANENSKKANLVSSVSAQTSADTSKIEPQQQKQQIRDLYESLKAGNSSLPQFNVFEKALAGYNALQNTNTLKNHLLTVIDYSLPSTTERMWVIDPINKKILWNTLVAHGRNSGHLMASSFSNIPGSFMSSLGFFITDKIYEGKHGMSLLLNGIEEGINNNAIFRAIVMHGADYVSYDFAKKNGYLGRSLGCPSIPADKTNEIIPNISNGSCLFIYYPDSTYLKQSRILTELN